MRMRMAPLLCMVCIYKSSLSSCSVSCWNGRVPIVKQLLDAGADPLIFNEYCAFSLSYLTPIALVNSLTIMRATMLSRKSYPRTCSQRRTRSWYTAWPWPQPFHRLFAYLSKKAARSGRRQCSVQTWTSVWARVWNMIISFLNLCQVRWCRKEPWRVSCHVQKRSHSCNQWSYSLRLISGSPWVFVYHCMRGIWCARLRHSIGNVFKSVRWGTVKFEDLFLFLS